MSKPQKLGVRDVADIPLREVSGFALRGNEVLAVGDREPTLFTAVADSWPLNWRGTDLSGLNLPDGGTQFEAVAATGPKTVLVLQEQPARVVHIDLAAPALLGTVLLEVPEGHPLREAWLGDRSSRGESLLLAERGHLLVVKEKNPAVILEFGPPGDQPVGWRRGAVTVPPAPADTTLTELATWTLSKELRKQLPDISDATLGPDGCLYLLSDQGSAIARLPDQLEPAGGEIGAEAVWRIGGRPENAEGLVILADGTALVGVDTPSPRRNLLRLESLELKPTS
ncbi:MAG: hypothetical protein KIH64_004430 [Mycobacterium sp.]|nr:hypothetical protein [Mycobacterium sp.]